MSPLVASFEVSAVDRAEVLRYLGYRGQAMTPELEGRIDQMCAHALDLARPKGCLGFYEVASRTVRGDGVPELTLVGCTLRLAGTSIAQHLDGAVSVGLMAVTLGTEVERELRRLSLTDPLGQLIFDATATAAIERAADAAEARLVSDAAASGLHTNWRFSPGYGDLPLSCQPDLLAALDAPRRLGISLTPSLLMVPTKSVTAVLGCFNEPQVRARPGCGSCNLRDFCSLHASGTTCQGGRWPERFEDG